MDKIKSTIQGIQEADAKIAGLARERMDSLTKPLGSLGKLEELAVRICAMKRETKVSLQKKVIFTFAADHGVTEEKISSYPKEVTAQMVYNFLNGGAGINVLARHVGAKVVVADLGVAADLKPHPQLVDKKIGYGTANIAVGPAMGLRDAEAAISAGMEIFEDEFNKHGIDIIGTGEMGIGNTTASSAIAAFVTGRPVAEVTSRGAGLDDPGMKNKVAVINRALAVNKPKQNDPLEILSKLGGFEIGGLSGAILAAAARKVPVVVDGFISSTAALIAYLAEPKVKDYLIASHNSVEKGHRAIMDYIGLTPLLDLGLRLGEGTGAALGIGLCDAALKIMNEMATFQSANVSQRSS
jgi:nicotinate-nucleotide--dimethylbenzimidazole phosphoribosyltransferase